MSTFAKVLLATDLTPQSDNLTECLFSLCPDTETEVVLAHVFDDDDDADPDGSNYKKVNSRLEGYKNDLEQAGYEEVKLITPVGDEPFEAICDAGEEHEADLLMVASHGKGFLKSTLMGSTTFDLARATTLPLFISKDDGVDASKLLDTILIPTDFSKKSLAALNVVRGLREFVGNVIFVHVIERFRSKEDRYNLCLFLTFAVFLAALPATTISKITSRLFLCISRTISLNSRTAPPGVLSEEKEAFGAKKPIVLYPQ